MDDAGQFLAHMRKRAPLVQNITNLVAMNVMANVMLAAGASPAMAHAIEETEEFSRLADALTINIGTLDAGWAAAMEAAARAAGKTWVLDPVAAGATRFRQDLCQRLIAHRPTIIRGNASEILALATGRGVGKGADAADAVAAAEGAARDLAARSGAVVAVTGPVDFVTDGTRGCRVANGHPMMPRVTALGCSLTGIVAAFAVDRDPFAATVAALAFYGIAGERAGSAAGPATFQTGFIDALFTLTPQQVSALARTSAA